MLENKVIELTQNLAKRTQENKSLLNQLSILESQVASWQEKHSTLQDRATTLEKDAIKANDAIAKTLILEKELDTLQSRYEETQRNLDNKETERSALKETLIKRAAELEEALHGKDSAERIHGSLNQEIQSLKLEVERLNQNGPSPVSPLSNGQKTPVSGKLGGLLSVSTGKRSNRTPRRRSYADGGDSSAVDNMRIGSVAYNPRPVSMAISPATLQKNWMGSPNGVDITTPIYDNIDSEVQFAHTYYLQLDPEDLGRG